MELDHFLKEPSERARRNLMLFSSLCIFLALLGELPTNVPLLGIDLKSGNKPLLTALAFFFTQLYLLFRFVVLAWIDLLNWLLKQDAQQRKGGRYNPSDMKISDILNAVREKLKNMHVTTVSRLARFLEQIFPITYGVVGVFASILLLSAQQV